MNRRVYEAIGLVALLWAGSGCGSNPAPAAGQAGAVVEAGPNQRLKFKPEYRQMLNKTGGVNIKPGKYEAYKKKLAADDAKK